MQTLRFETKTISELRLKIVSFIFENSLKTTEFQHYRKVCIENLKIKLYTAFLFLSFSSHVSWINIFREEFQCLQRVWLEKFDDEQCLNSNDTGDKANPQRTNPIEKETNRFGRKLSHQYTEEKNNMKDKTSWQIGLGCWIGGSRFNIMKNSWLKTENNFKNTIELLCLLSVFYL